MSDARGASAPAACLIVGLGNSLMQDDGVGVHAVRRLMEDPPPGVGVLEIGTDVFGAVSWLDGLSWVLAIDAMDAGRPPGTIYKCDLSQVAGFQRPLAVHELSLLAMLEFIPEARRPEITVIGVQPAVLEFGLELSPAVAAAVPRVLEVVRSIVATRLTAIA